MNYIQKLGRHMTSSTMQTAVGSWVTSYDAKVNTAVNRLKFKKPKGIYNEASLFHDKFPVSIAIMSTICYAALPRSNAKAYLDFYMPQAMRKQFPKTTKTVEEALRKNPRWVIFNARAMFPVYHNIVKDDKPNWDKFSAEGKIVEEILNTIWRVWPWAGEHHGGPKKQLTFKNVMKYGLIVDGSKLSMQRIFTQGMVLRFVLEHYALVVPAYRNLRKMGFTQEQAAQLVYFIKNVDGGRAIWHHGGGHDFVCGMNLTREHFIAIMKGDWVPKWDEDPVWMSQSDCVGFKMFKATSPEVVAEKRAVGLTIVDGEAWNRRTYIDLNKVKELVNE